MESSDQRENVYEAGCQRLVCLLAVAYGDSEGTGDDEGGSHQCFQENETSNHTSSTGTKTIRKQDSDLVFVKCNLRGLAILSITGSAFCKTETEWNHNHGLGRNITNGRSNKLTNCGRSHCGNIMMLASAFLLLLIEHTVFIVKEIITYCFIDLLFQILSLPRNSSKIDCGLPAKGNTIGTVAKQAR